MDIFDNGGKRKLYDLLEQYCSDQVDEEKFCDEFYYLFEISAGIRSALNDLEKKAFDELSSVASRFSAYEEDHALDRRAFSTREELREKIIDTRKKLVI